MVTKTTKKATEIVKKDWATLVEESENITELQVKFLTLTGKEWEKRLEELGGILPSILTDNVGNALEGEDGKMLGNRQINRDDLQGMAMETIWNQARFAISPLSEGEDGNTIFDEDAEDGHNGVNLNGKRWDDYHEKYKMEIQPLFTVNKNSDAGQFKEFGHWRGNGRREMQIQEFVLQPDNWDTMGLTTLIHERVHAIMEYLWINDCSKKGQHNKMFQAMAISMGLNTVYDEDKKHCSTPSLTEEFYAWFDGTFLKSLNTTREQVSKDAFNKKAIMKPRTKKTRRQAVVNDVAIWINSNKYEQALCPNDCCQITKTENYN